MSAATDLRAIVWRYRGRCLGLALLVSYLAASCVLIPRPPRAARNQWNQDRGPVVPHDSFPTDCLLCHVRGNWTQLRDDFTFDHARETGVPLIGAHRDAQCLRCHNDRGPVARFAQRGCVGCHEDFHRGQLGQRCEQCHQQNDWRPEGQIALHNRTRFPLVGSHTAVACFRCHPGAQVGNFQRAPVECEACHQQDLQRATQPNHTAQGWTHDCQRCHKPITWRGAGFQHTAFPLVGAHATVDCAACHHGGVFTGLSHDCASCHIQDFQAAQNPNHVVNHFSTNCQSCHNTVSWRGATFNHAGITNNCVQCHLPEFNATTNPNHVAQGFSTACENCHNTLAWRGGVFSHNGITNGCDRCHLPDYQGTTNPDHVAQGFPLTCEACHNTVTWQGATFNHNGIASGCDRCHLPDYNRTTNPNHAALGFPTQCESCHNTTTWQGATFNHNGITNNCDRCHLTDYNNTRNPNHIAAGFPRTCETCHNTTRWQGANFNHRFNIKSGPHRKYQCSECHQVPTNYSIVSCTHCHAHNQQKMFDKHKKRAGYSWNSPACIRCHPRGKG